MLGLAQDQAQKSQLKINLFQLSRVCLNWFLENLFYLEMCPDLDLKEHKKSRAKSNNEDLENSNLKFRFFNK